MIQVCSRCGTRWNRCATAGASGARVATARCWRRRLRRSRHARHRHLRWRTPAGGRTAVADRPQPAGRTRPDGYSTGYPLDRGARPERSSCHPADDRRNFGPDAPLCDHPRAGDFVDHFDQTASHEQQCRAASGSRSARLARATLIATIAVLGIAALVHLDALRAV